MKTNMQVFEAVAKGRMTPEEGAEYLMMLRERESTLRWGKAARVSHIMTWILLVAFLLFEWFK